MLPRAKKGFLALLIYSWTAWEADKLYCHQIPKHLTAGVAEVLSLAIFSFSWSLYCRPILTTFSKIANDICLLAYSIFRFGSDSQIISMNCSTRIGLAHRQIRFYSELIRQLWASTWLVELVYQFLISLHNFSLTPMLYRCCNRIGCATESKAFSMWNRHR